MTAKKMNDSQLGFTLIELMLALSLMGLLAATSVAAWRIGINAQERVERIASASRRESFVANFIVAQMEAVVPMKMRINQGAMGLSFVGTPSSMMLVSRYSLARRSRGGLVLARYRVARDGDETRLMYAERRISSQFELSQVLGAAVTMGSGPDQEAALDLGESRWTTLIEKFTDGYFEYFGKVRVDQEPVWERTWNTASGKLPQGIALRFSAGPETIGQPPTAIVSQVNVFEDRVKPFSLYGY